MRGHAELWEAMDEKEALLAAADDEFDADRYAELEDVILRHDGYALEARAAEILEGLGIPTERPPRAARRPCPAASSCACCSPRCSPPSPDALLLDEPTNHLDILSIRWLEKFLADYAGLRRGHLPRPPLPRQRLHAHRSTSTTRRLPLYTGNYASLRRGQAGERERREAEIAKREKEIADHQAFVERFRAKATKARQAQSRSSS